MGGGGSKGGGGGGVDVSAQLAARDREWQAEMAKRDAQWALRVNEERTAAQNDLLKSQADTAYKNKLNKPAGKLDAQGGGIPNILTSAQGLGDSSASTTKAALLGG